MTADPQFLQGIAYAAAFISGAHHEETIAADLLSESGYKLKDFVEAKVANYDLKELRRLWRTERRWRGR